MKHGLMIYHSNDGINKNIGDYIQSIAAMKYLNDNPILVEREALHEYSGPSIKLILNGWFMHIPENWPPSDKILPLFISFHINPDISECMITDKNIKYFKKYEPIGCRDTDTMRLLNKVGVKSYYSSCLTLTLGDKYKKVKNNGKIIFVDPYNPIRNILKSPLLIIKLLLTISFNYSIIKKISKNQNNKKGIKSMLMAGSFYKLYSKLFYNIDLINADFEKHAVLESQFGNEQSKFDYANKLLIKYSNAKFIVTSRIHCALPSLSMGTPFIFVTSDMHSSNKYHERGRFGGVMKLFNNVKYDKFTLNIIDNIPLDENGKIQIDKIQNKSSFYTLRDNLNDKVKSFIGNH